VLLGFLSFWHCLLQHSFTGFADWVSMSSVPADVSLYPLRRSAASWMFSLYPDAGEGGGSF
jgi:hypothetical protein